MDISAIRADTPCTYVYLDHTAASVPPRPVVEAVQSYFNDIVQYGPKHFAVAENHYLRLQAARRSIASLINAEPDEIVLCHSGSEALSAVAAGLAWQAGDGVVLSRAEMISNVAPWLRLRDSQGVEVRFAGLQDPGTIDFADVERLVDDRTRVVSLTHVANTLGVIHPLAVIGQKLRDHRCLFVVDACASVGAVPIDVKALGCDILVGSGRKYLRGPAGSAFMYVRRDVLEQLRPPFFGWKTGAWRWNDWSHHEIEYNRDGSRFWTGEPTFPNWFGLGRAAEYAQEVGGVQEILTRTQSLAKYLIDRLVEMPAARVVGPITTEQRSGIVMVAFAETPIKVAADYLQARGIMAEGGHGYAPGPLEWNGVPQALRLALHYWNTEEDIDKTVEFVRRIR